MEKWEDFKETENVTINPSALKGIDYDYVGRGVVEYFESNPKRYKIKMRKSIEHEIDEESKRITTNALVVGATVLATTVCVLATTNADLEATQRIGTFLMSFITTKEFFSSAKVLNESMKRKTKLENTYFDTYGEEYINEGKKR